jgi:hypothetical protein
MKWVFIRRNKLPWVGALFGEGQIPHCRLFGQATAFQNLPI